QLVSTPHRNQQVELHAQQIELVNSTAKDYPLQKQAIPLEVSKAIHDFFDQEGFYYIPTPIITSNDTEGAGELFTIQPKDFFHQSSQLTVSGQLHAEALTQGLGKVYTFSPCFRAEKSHTTRHLAEF
ncbi:10508_t:CDS:2, partial [Ambispora leptoticha]